MGVAGAGKTLVGRMLADRLGWAFLDADDFHPPSNIEKMRGGVPLDPADRTAWLSALRAALQSLVNEGRDATLACSALREEFRRALARGFGDLRFVYLKADRELIRTRVATRAGHFMPAALVDSQFETLEEPEDAMVVDAGAEPHAIVSAIATAL